MKKEDTYHIILASKSPRRQQLLAGMDIEFEIITKDTDEDFPDDMPLDKVAAYLCEKKADAFDELELPENYLLITADTVVVVDGIILNKPADEAEAVSMLQQLSGNCHEVITGICLRSAKYKKVFSEQSRVQFGHLDVEEIQHYVKQYQPFDKAGAYGIQEWIGYVGIRSIEGSFYNVMGLPTHRLFHELKAFPTP
jgi:septum formation protein